MILNGLAEAAVRRGAGAFRRHPCAWDSREIRKYCELGTDSELLLERAMVKQGLSARAHDRILKVARTVADLTGAETIEPGHIAEAIQYRTLDRTLWA